MRFHLGWINNMFPFSIQTLFLLVLSPAVQHAKTDGLDPLRATKCLKAQYGGFGAL